MLLCNDVIMLFEMSIIIPTNITSVFFWGDFFAIFDIKSNDFSTLKKLLKKSP